MKYYLPLFMSSLIISSIYYLVTYIYFIMKKILFILFIIMLIITILLNFKIKATTYMGTYLFVLDAGHGGKDPGTISGSIYEKDINLQIVLYLKEELERLGARVILTRDGDYDLATPNAFRRKKSDFDHRISLINNSKADYYLSIHLNYLDDSSYYGPQVFYSTVNDKNKDIALKLQKELNSYLGTNREIKKISNTIYMYQRLTVPGVLIECGFLSNKNEREKLTNDKYLREYAKVVAKTFLKI